MDTKTRFICVLHVRESCPILWFHGLKPARFLCPWDFPGKNTEVGCHILLKGIFPTQRSNLSISQCRQIFTVCATREAGICDKLGFQTKTVTADEERHYKTIRGPIQEEEVTIINMFAPNIGTPKYIKQITDIRGETDGNTTIVGDFSITLISKARSSRKKINNNTGLKWNIRPDIYRESLYIIYICPWKSSKIHILFKCTWNTLQDRLCVKPQNKSQ